MITALEDDTLLNLLGFIPDVESIVRCALTCKRLYNFIMSSSEEDANSSEDEHGIHKGNVLWEALDRKLDTKMVGKPRDLTARNRVCRFAAASLFAKRIETFAPAHHYSLLGHSCPGCDQFPDACSGQEKFCDYSCYGIDEVSKMFVRITVHGEFIWEGFLLGQISNNGSIYLTVSKEEREDRDLRPALEKWTKLQKFVTEYPDFPPELQRLVDDGDIDNEIRRIAGLTKFYHVNGDIESRPVTGAREFANRLRAYYDRLYMEAVEGLSVTIIGIEKDINDRQLLVTTHGHDKDKLAFDGYCSGYQGNQLAPMPALAHGVCPIIPPGQECDYTFFRTSPDDVNYPGSVVLCSMKTRLASSKTKPGKVEGFCFIYLDIEY